MFLFTSGGIQEKGRIACLHPQTREWHERDGEGATKLGQGVQKYHNNKTRSHTVETEPPRDK